jgi:phosphoribosylformylglycinamidine (FGAM) synthase-like enzyme
LIVSCHDVSDGGALVAAAEMAIGSELGLELTLPEEKELAIWIQEMRGAYLVELPAAVMTPGNAVSDQWYKLFQATRAQQGGDGVVTKEARMKVYVSAENRQKEKAAVDVGVEELRKAWQGTLDW